MNEKPTTGTICLDGMLQGRLPDSTAADNMRSWITSVKKSGLVFHFSIDGPNFSIVPDPTPQRSSRLSKPDLEELLSEALEALLSFLSPEEQATAISTIRSEEFRPGEATQVVYAIGPGGTINAQQRTVDADTLDPPPEITPASIKRAILPALFFLVVALFVSSFFIDYRKLWSEAKDKVVPLKKEEVAIDQKAVTDYVTIELIEVDEKRRTLHFELTRGPKWDTAFSSTPATTESWPDLRNRLAIHQGRLLIEFRNKEDNIIGKSELKLESITKESTGKQALVTNLNDRLARIIVSP
jgi:hypothetical protein